MTIPFSKFDGAGNDFVIVDNRNLGWHPDEEQVTAMCTAASASAPTA